VLLEAGTLLVGEIDDELTSLVTGRAGVVAPGEAGRAGALAELGHARLVAGEPAEPALLRPVYLRPPAIGPQQRTG
jgi:hypothetical protein